MTAISSRISRYRDDPVIARCAPFLLFIALLVLAQTLSPAAPEKSASAIALWVVVSRAVIVAAALAWFWRGYSELREPSPTHPAQWLIAPLAGLAVFVVWIWFDEDWAVLSRSPGFDPSLPDGAMHWPMAIARLAGFALVVPVMEELFWRSLVLRWIVQHEFLSVAPRRVGVRAFVITTVLFALEHDRWIGGAFAGIVYNAIYMRSGNLWVPIVAHMVTNAALGIWVLHTQNWQFW